MKLNILQKLCVNNSLYTDFNTLFRQVKIFKTIFSVFSYTTKQ